MIFRKKHRNNITRMPIFHILMVYLTSLKFRLSERRGIMSLFLEFIKREEEWEKFKKLPEVTEPCINNT